MAYHTMKRNDTLDVITDTILDPRTGVAVDLTGCTVKFIMKLRNAASAKVNAAAAIVTAVLGKVKYVWITGDTDVAGTYDAEWQVTFIGGTIRTFPQGTNREILIVADLGD